MALPALSNGVTLPAKMRHLGIAGKVACAIVGIPSSRLSLCTSGIQDLSSDDAAKLHALLNKLSEIQQAVHPFPLLFSGESIVERWKNILDRMDKENISVESIAVAMEQLFKQQFES